MATRLLEALAQDARHALRAAARAPGFTAVIVLSLALGIGANAAVFTVINAVMLRDLPVRDPGRLVELRSRYPGEPAMNGFGWTVYDHFRERARTLSDLAGAAPARARFQVSGDRLEPEIVDGDYVSGNLFPMLGIQPAIGRLIGPDEDRRDVGDAAVVVIAWSYWRSRFDLDPAVLGTRLVVNGVPATVIGVAPRGFPGLYIGAGRPTSLWVPAAMEPMARGGSPPLPGLHLIGRLQPGVEIEEAQAELRVLDRFRIEGLAKGDPQWREATLEVTPAGGGFAYLSDHFGAQLIVLMAIVALVLLIACTNVASLLMARAVTRHREMAVRVALGAGRARLVRQALTESVLLASAAGALGIGLAWVGARALVASWPIDGRSGLQQYDVPLQPDAAVLGFTLLVALATAVLSGFAPAWTAFGSAAASPLRESGFGSATRSRRRLGQALVVGQVAVSVVLLGGAVLFAGHVSDLRTRDLGFRPGGVLLVTLDPSRSGRAPEALFQSYQALVARLGQIPGVRAASLAAVTPMQGGEASRFVRVDGFEESPDARRRVSLNWVAPGYFEALGVSMRAGRDFAAADERGPRVAIVNERFALHYFEGSSAVGRRFTLEKGESYEIVGVVPDMKYARLHEPAPRTIFLSALQEERGRIHQLLVSADAPVVAQVRAAVRDLLPSVPVARVRTLDDQLNASIVVERQMAGLSSVLGAAGALLAGLGLYGLVAFTVARRTSEIGIRMALGATGRDVVWMVLSSALGLVVVGLVVGVPLAWWGQRLGGSLVPSFGGGVVVPMVLAGVGMVVVAVVAAWLPARRAARVQPVEALRQG